LTPTSKTAKAKEHEEYVAAKLGGRRSRSSGARFNDDIDVVTPEEVIECEYTEGKSISVKRSLYEEVRLKTFGGRRGLIALRFRDEFNRKNDLDLIAMSLDDYEEIKEQLSHLAYLEEKVGEMTF
jgi:hypothetical protein